MNLNRTEVFRTLLAAMIGMSALVQAGPAMSVHDVKGRALEIELLSVNGKSVRFRRADTAKDFTVALDQFDADSQAKIIREAATLPTPLPPLIVEVVIGKRRKKENSYYMVTQEISCTVKMHNSSNDIPLPKLTGKIIFIGRNQRQPDEYIVLSAQEFPVELQPGADSANALEPFVTTYDSDNKGQGNVGGFQYTGHLLVFVNDKDEVVFNQTTDADIRKAITAKPALLSTMAGYSNETPLDDKMNVRNQKKRLPIITN
ncbi:MAG: hypothetical protein ABI600_08190 [Luteolibacter sp.]